MQSSGQDRVNFMEELVALRYSYKEWALVVSSEKDYDFRQQHIAPPFLRSVVHIP